MTLAFFLASSWKGQISPCQLSLSASLYYTADGPRPNEVFFTFLNAKKCLASFWRKLNIVLEFRNENGTTTQESNVV